MNRSLPPGGRGNRSTDPGRPSGPRRLMLGTVGLVGRTADIAIGTSRSACWPTVATFALVLLTFARKDAPGGIGQPRSDNGPQRRKPAAAGAGRALGASG